MARKKILWLASWYPHQDDPFNGDFIQRHARAAAIYNDIHLIYVAEREMEQPVVEEMNFVTGLTEQIIYYRKKNGLLKKFRKHYIWRNLFRKAVENYIARHGLPDCIHVQVPWKAGLIALWIKSSFGIPYLLTEHWGIYDEHTPDTFRSKPGIQQELTRKIFSNAEAWITVSAFLARQIELTLDGKCNRIIPNVVDTSLFFHKEEKYNRFTFLHVSNMVKLKNVDLILEAFRDFLKSNDHPEVQLVLIGNRDDKYVKMAARMGLLNETVFFRGEISYHEVAEEMRRSHCLVLFSDSETFSCVAAEALCSGLPVVTLNRGALPELVNESNGIIVAIKERAALLQALTQVRNEYSGFDHKKIAESAAGKYGYSPVSEQFNQLYKDWGRPPAINTGLDRNSTAD